MLKSYFVLPLGAVLLCAPSSAADFLTGQAARAVIGQPFFNAQNSGASNTLLGGVGGLAYVNNTLFVADSNRLGLLPDNNRVLIFNSSLLNLPAADAEIPPYSGRCPVCGGQASVVVGQPNFTTVDGSIATRSSLRLPTAIASDGRTLAVADTANNRVMIWNSIPTTNGQPADVVLGQVDFTTVAKLTVTASALRGPQGVWIQNRKLFVADTQNNRILIWNSIPTQNNQPADLVLGQPNFTSAPEVNQINLSLPATAKTMLSPTSVSSDGTRLYVSDLGFNRVLIWKTIPTSTQQAADLEIGQKDFTFSIPNDAPDLCNSTGVDSSGTATFPARCGSTLSFPRYALSDGQRLFIADGGNDRVLVYNSIPTANAAKADVILGQPDEFIDVYSSNDPVVISSADVLPTPTSLAWDAQNQNLYVADATDYRVLVFSPARPDLPITGIVNAASRAVFAIGSFIVGGTITDKNTITGTINGTAYTYTVAASDTLETVALGLAKLINAGAGDPNVFAFEERGIATVRLLARKPGPDGNNITLATATSSTATVTLGLSGGTLRGGGSAGIVAPGSIVLLRGSNLADTTASAAPDGINLPETLPFELAGVQVYFDGIRAPLFSVSPTEIKAQLPFMVTGADSVSAWVRVKRAGSVTVTTAVNIQVEDQNPGIFADETLGAQEPRTALAVHASNFATGTISVDGVPEVGGKGTITIGDSSYIYTVVKDDTLSTVRDAFVALINADPDSPVIASRAGVFTRIRLRAKAPGPDGNGIPISAVVVNSSTNTTGDGLILTTTNTVLCCASAAGRPVTIANPAIPGETIIVYATGLGLVCASPVVASAVNYCSASPDAALSAIVDGAKYRGPTPNAPIGSVSGLLGNASVNVISASLLVGQIGLYEVVLEIGQSSIPSLQSQLTISQGLNTSNIVVIPIGSPPQQ